MPPRPYHPRAIEPLLLKAARQFPALVLTGPRQSGKSTLLQRIFPKHRYVTLDEPAQRLLAGRDPERFLEDLGRQAILDEIQLQPGLLPYLKIAIDRDRSRTGRFLLTGSQMFPLMAGVTESLAGRSALFELLGFSWEELPDTPRSVDKCFQSLFQGFYPEPALRRTSPAPFYSSYIQTYLERDIRQIRNVHDLSHFQSFLELLAARAGSLLNLNEIAKECGITQPTARQWLALLESSRIVYLLRPYHRNVTKRVVKTPKLYFTDTGLLAHLLRYPDGRTLASGPMAGAFFENMMVMEALKWKWNHQLPWEPYFYRDSNGNETDLLLDRGTEILFMEFKLSKTLRPDFGKGLQRSMTAFRGLRSGCVISFANLQASLAENIEARPWWQCGPFFLGKKAGKP